MVYNKAEKVGSAVEFRGRLRPLIFCDDNFARINESLFYQIWGGGEGPWLVNDSVGGSINDEFENLEEAKAAAQAEYQELIYSLFDVLP